MASLVKQFIDSLDGQVVELPDIELADLTEDSEATWAQNKTENEQTDQIEFLKRRIIATQELGDERYVGQKVSSKNVFTGGRISDLAHIRFDASTGVSENPEKEDSELSQSKNKNVVADGVITISNDTQRGKAESVQKQLMIWDRLMQLHILSHAALRIFNQLPRDQLAKKLLQSADLDTKKNCRIMQKNLEQLNEIFTTMEDKLLKSAKQTKGFSDDNCGKRVENSDDEEIESLIDCNEEDDSAIESDTKESEGDSDICLSNASITQDNETVNRDQQILGKRKKLMPKELTKEYEKRHERFAAFQSSTLSKWDERTTLNAIGIIKNRKKDFSGFESVVLKQIEQIMNEKHRLLRRTQMKRHDVDRIGGVEGNDYDAEIFDDDDFYQQLLKELIERKSANVVDPVEMSRQWLEVQKLRQKRSKRRKVDTKASKGRKIRYVVIPKLVNFFPSMAEKATWSHEKRNQLFKSLFSS
uniref:Bm7110, isoform d n=1 Tax=Brugia malayi TaxID=6279 RepID=A0A7I4KQF7_BRUMA